MHASAVSGEHGRPLCFINTVTSRGGVAPPLPDDYFILLTASPSGDSAAQRTCCSSRRHFEIQNYSGGDCLLDFLHHVVWFLSHIVGRYWFCRRAIDRHARVGVSLTGK